MSKPPYFGWQHLGIWGDSESKLNQIMGHTIKRAHEANMESEAVVKLELNLEIQMIHHKTFMRSNTSQVSFSWLRYICPGLSSSSSTKKSQLPSSATCQCNIERVKHFSDLHPLLLISMRLRRNLDNNTSKVMWKMYHIHSQFKLQVFNT
jgi:hypothetical protein